MNVSYYPIKKNEMIQIIKMINQYKKKDFSDINRFFEDHNINRTNKDDIYSSFNECIASMDNSSFDESYGLCIAKIQKVFRGNFNFNDKSITELLKKVPVLSKYRTNWETFIQTKSNKFRFNNELLDENKETSGVYISYNKLKGLYSVYQSDSNTKEQIDQYYGIMIDRFIQAINYCLENECGLLEATFTVKTTTQSNINQTTNTPNIKNIQLDEKNRPIVSVSSKIWSIIGYKVLFEIISILIINNLANLLISNIESVTTKLIVSAIVVALTVFIEWFGCIHLSFTSTTVEESKLPAILRAVTIIFLVILAINSYSYFKTLSKEVDKETTYALSTNKEIIQKEVQVRIYGKQNELDDLNKSKRNLKDEVKKEVYKKMAPYYIAIYAINIAGLFYARRKIKKMI